MPPCWESNAKPVTHILGGFFGSRNMGHQLCNLWWPRRFGLCAVHVLHYRICPGGVCRGAISVAWMTASTAVRQPFPIGSLVVVTAILCAADVICNKRHPRDGSEQLLYVAGTRGRRQEGCRCTLHQGML